MRQKSEAQIYGDFTIQLYRVTKKYKHDADVVELWHRLDELDAARRELKQRGCNENNHAR